MGRLVASGATVVLFTAFDPGGSAIYRPMRGRFALYNEAVREISDRHGTLLVDFWRMREYRDWGYWDTDRMHLGPAGHQHMAMQVLDALGVPHQLQDLPPTAHPELSGRELRAQNLAWARTHAVPWVHRRLTGRSSGDSRLPEATHAGPDRTCLPGRVASPRRPEQARHADVAQLVERDLPKVDVASSNLVIRSMEISKGFP